MKLRPENIKVDPVNPFEKDLLKREQYANVLTQIVKNSEGGFTLSINADWGYGKTTFVRMWKAALQNEGYKTIYFNAWESDFVADPMIALVDGIRDGFDSQDLPQENLQLSQAIWKSAAKLIQLVPQFKVVGEVFEIFQNGINDCLADQNKLQEHQSYHKLILDFKEQLSKFSKEISPDKQLVIFVDELDRCRPDYAVQMLERIKHFFEVENIIFVLSIDKKVISESIRTVYGDIDVDGYLRRFLDLEFDLPEPDISDFVEAQFNIRELSKFFTGYWDYNSKTWENEDREKNLRISLWDCLLTQNVSLRDVEKYFNRLEIILNSKALPHTNCDLIAFILSLYMFHRNIYNELHYMNASTDKMWQHLKPLLDVPRLDKRTSVYNRYYYLFIKFLAFYIVNLEFKDQYRDPIFESYRNGEGLDWFPEKSRKVLVQEINNHTGQMMQDLLPHFELVNARFDMGRKEEND